MDRYKEQKKERSWKLLFLYKNLMRIKDDILKRFQPIKHVVQAKLYVQANGKFSASFASIVLRES